MEASTTVTEDAAGLITQAGDSTAALLVHLQEITAVFGLKILAAIAIFIFGRIVARLIRSGVKSMLERSKVDETLVSFTTNLTYVLLMTFVIIAALGKLGVQTASFVAVMGAAGLAIGMALQGSLANFAAGVMLIIFRPLKVGDLIEAAGVLGVVQDINIFTTEVLTLDNKLVIVPNAKLSGDNITNFSTRDLLRVDLVFGIGYTDSIDKAKEVMAQVLAENDKVLKDPAPTIAVLELGDNSVNFACRPWCSVANYWDVYFGVNEAVKKAFDANGISIPFPQRDVHLHTVKED